MISQFYLSIVIFVIKFHEIFGQDEMIQCRYYNQSSNVYTCDLTIYNPNGLNNFTVINGTHMTGKSNALVNRIYRDQIFVTPIVPSIICKQFTNLEGIYFYLAKIHKLDKYSFSDCKNLFYLYLYNNEITQIGEYTFSNCQNLIFVRLYNNKINQFAEKSFDGASKVQYLRLDNNPIQNFPKNIFKPLTSLIQLEAYSTNLTVLHSDSFGVHLKLTHLHLQKNQIDAFDERIIDKTAVNLIDMTNNICANKLINDTTMMRDSMRLALKKCFENYENLTIGKKIF